MSSREVTPREAFQRQARGATLVDVRDEHERSLGMAEGAIGVAKAELEADPALHAHDRNAELVLICQSGGRSLLAAELLQRSGYVNVVSVLGGTSRWIAEGLPVRKPLVVVDHDFHDRYSRHLRLPEVGVVGQRRLEASRVLMIGRGASLASRVLPGRGGRRATAPDR